MINVWIFYSLFYGHREGWIDPLNAKSSVHPYSVKTADIHQHFVCYTRHFFEILTVYLCVENGLENSPDR